MVWASPAKLPLLHPGFLMSPARLTSSFGPQCIQHAGKLFRGYASGSIVCCKHPCFIGNGNNGSDGNSDAAANTLASSTSPRIGNATSCIAVAIANVCGHQHQDATQRLMHPMQMLTLSLSPEPCSLVTMTHKQLIAHAHSIDHHQRPCESPGTCQCCPAQQWPSRGAYGVVLCYRLRMGTQSM